MILLSNPFRKQIIRLTISKIIKTITIFDDNNVKKTIKREYIEENVEYSNYYTRKF